MIFTYGIGTKPNSRKHCRNWSRLRGSFSITNSGAFDAAASTATRLTMFGWAFESRRMIEISRNNCVVCVVVALSFLST